MAPAFWAAVLGVALAAAAPAMADEAPKYGGILTFMIPADAPPSFDAHREGTFATVHSAAPFYSVLIRVDPNNPSSTTDFVCDLCAAVPQPTDSGRTYTFKIRDGVNMCSTLRRTRSFCFGTTGWFPTGRMSKAGRSARAITSTRTWRQSGSTNDQIGKGLPRITLRRWVCLRSVTAPAPVAGGRWQPSVELASHDPFARPIDRFDPPQHPGAHPDAAEHRQDERSACAPPEGAEQEFPEFLKRMRGPSFGI